MPSRTELQRINQTARTAEWWLVISNNEADSLTQLASMTVPNPRFDDTREIRLLEGPYTDETRPDVDSVQSMEYSDRISAIGDFLFSVETHGASEDEAWGTLRSQLDISDYEAYLDELTPKDRRLKHIDILEERAEDDPLAEFYLSHGQWLETGITEDAMTLVEDIAAQFDPNPRLCYRNIFEIYDQYKDNNRVQYIEGTVLPKQAGRIATHAWLAIDGCVVEFTFPWHQYEASEAVYFGSAVPIEQYEWAREYDRELFSPIAVLASKRFESGGFNEGEVPGMDFTTE